MKHGPSAQGFCLVSYFSSFGGRFWLSASSLQKQRGQRQHGRLSDHQFLIEIVLSSEIVIMKGVLTQSMMKNICGSRYH